MTTEVPDHLAVPSSWVHGDLLKLRTRLEAHCASERVNELKLLQGAIATQVLSLEKSTHRRQKRLERLTRELQELTSEQEVEVCLQENGQRIMEGARNQIYYQKGTSRNYLVPSSSCAVDECRPDEACPLSLYGFSLLHCCVSGNSTPPDEISAVAFLKFCAPLFQWNAEEGLVKPPFFFDEPCLLERTAEEEEAAAAAACAHSSSAPREPPQALQCRNAACAYWHRDQLAHVKLAAHFCVAALREGCVGDEQLCRVRYLTSRIVRQVQQAGSVPVVCALLCEALQTVLGLGLHLHLVKGKDAAQSMGAPAISAADVEHAGPARAELLRRAEEQQRWATLMEQRIQTPTALPSSVAAAAFQKHRDALSWRCLLASVTDAPQRFWLARQGVQLFPSCPQLHLEYILACVRHETSTEKVIDACLSSCRSLSAQAAASVVAGLDGGQYGTTVARHVGYIVALVFVHCAKADVAAATQFLAPLLSTDAEAEVAALLLPVARQNLALMSVALRRVGHLHGVEHLPLAAVSDVLFELGTPDGANPAESGRDVLYASLKLLGEYKHAHFAPQLTTTCAGALQLSLLRTFSHKLSYLERVAEKTVPESALAQGAVYGAYVCAVAQQQSVPAAAQVSEALAAADGATCFLNMLLGSQMRMWGCQTQVNAEQAIAQLCTTEQLPLETLDSAAAVREAVATHPDVSAVEWVSAYTLHLLQKKTKAANDREEEQRLSNAVDEEKWTALLKFPTEVLLGDAVAAALYFSMLLQRSGAWHDAAKFYDAVYRCLCYFRELHMHTWSPLDASYTALVGLPHYLALLIYQAVPLVLGTAAKDTYDWRCLVLAAAAELGVMHPLLMSGTAST